MVQIWWYWGSVFGRLWSIWSVYGWLDVQYHLMQALAGSVVRTIDTDGGTEGVEDALRMFMNMCCMHRKVLKDTGGRIVAVLVRNMPGRAWGSDA